MHNDPIHHAIGKKPLQEQNQTRHIAAVVTGARPLAPERLQEQIGDDTGWRHLSLQNRQIEQRRQQWTVDPLPEYSLAESKAIRAHSESTPPGSITITSMPNAWTSIRNVSEYPSSACFEG